MCRGPDTTGKPHDESANESNAMRMKAAVQYAVNEPLVVQEVELDPPKAGEVLIKLAATGVCHSDLRAFQGENPRPFPTILGHEGAGVVQEVGPGVTDVVPGDHVVLTFLPACGKCRWCHIGHPNKCDLAALIRTGRLLDGTTRHHLPDGTDISSFLFISTFAEYTVAPEASILKVPNHLPLDRLCLFGCGFTTGFGATTNAVHIRPGESVTIVGCGGLGLSAIQGAHLSGAGTIIAIDLHESKLEMARKFGATHTIQNRGDIDAIIEEINEVTWGVGTDYSFEIVGLLESDETLNIAFRAARKGGTVCFVGGGSPDRRTIPVDPFTLQQWQKTITGVLFGASQFKVDIPRFISLYEKNRINLDDLITHQFALEDINTALNNLHRPDGIGRQIIVF